MLNNFKPRLYQETILGTCIKKNTLVVLPTGMGKTAIAILLASYRLRLFPNSKILFLAPTKPLAEQHLQTFKKFLKIDQSNPTLFTGFVKPDKRAKLWKTSQLIFSTPQGLENDIISKRINLEQVSLLIFDEAHRAVGDYSYVFVAKQYQSLAKFPRILALTASPGSDLEKIQEIIQNLFIEEIEVRTDSDKDVKPYIKEIKIDWIKVDLPPLFQEIQKSIKLFLKERLQKLKDWGILRRTNLNFVNKKDLLSLQAQLRGRAAQGEKDFILWNAISVLAEIMKVQHGLELLETQGIKALYIYLKKLESEAQASKTKAVKNIVNNQYFKTALFKTSELNAKGYQHPKLIELQKIIEKETKNNSNIKIIVFNQYRDNAADIVNIINNIPNVKAKVFVGQAKKADTGLTQKQQIEILNQFKENKFNTIVMTSVGEEGLDIPKVDLVIFFEPIPSAIRHIQRRGRTGRQEKGRVIVLMTKNTRDEGYRWSAHHKEKRMHRTLSDIKNKIKLVLKPQPTLKKFVKTEKTRIYADYREKSSKVIKELIDMGIDIKLEKLETADYILSSRTGVELKTIEDFASSIIDGRLLEQIKILKKNFEKPLIILEGIEDIYSVRNIHPNAIRGMLATIAISYGIPILTTKNPKETAALFSVIAKREQQESGSDFQPHALKTVSTLKEQQEYIVSSLPNIGLSTAKELLKKFRTVKKIINAKEEKLKKVDKVGDKKAKQIREVVDSEYEE